MTHAPMTLKDLKRRMVLRYTIAGVEMNLYIYAINRRVGKGRVLVETSRMDRGFGGQQHSIVLFEGDDLDVYSYHGVKLYPGMTQAEINAEEVAERCRKAGFDVNIKIKDDPEYGQRMVSVRIRGDVFSDTLFGTWISTSREGRRNSTKWLLGSKYRGPFRAKGKKSSVKLSSKDFYRSVGDLCWSSEYKAAKGLED